MFANAAIQTAFQSQHGVASRQQLVDRGVHKATIARWAKCGALVRVHPGVYRSASAPATPESRLFAAQLAVQGAVASHRAAAWLHGFVGLERLGFVEFSTTKGARAKGVLVHRVAKLDPIDVTTVRGIPVTREGRTLVDLCDVLPEKAVAKALDDAIRRRVVSLNLLRELLAARSPRRKGSRVLAALLAERTPLEERAASELESRFLRLIRGAGLPEPEVNVDLLREGAFVARPDVMWSALGVAVFLDGRAFHSAPPEFEKDRTQANTLTAAGWVVLRFTWQQVVGQGEDVLAQLRAVLSRAAAPPAARGRRAPLPGPPPCASAPGGR